MTTISTLARAASVLMLAALITVTAGCSSGGEGSPAAPQPSGDNSSPPEQIQGVATPSSVAVVTATNAQ
jgi:hypothetical protein